MSQIQQQCPLCGSSEQAVLYVTRDRHFGIQGMYRIVRCCICSLVFLNPMYSDAELTVLYPTDYYAYRIQPPSRSIKSVLYRLLLDVHTRDPNFSVPGRVLDLGCGTGSFLREMRDQGWLTHGVEINTTAARVGRDVERLDIFCGSLQDAGFAAEFFDYVRSNHSLEHITCPNETLEEIHRIMKPGGKLMIGLPNIDSLTARTFGRYWWYLGAPLHTFNYSVATLCSLLRRHGFVPERVIYNSDRHGILGSLQIWLNRNTKRKSTDGRAMHSRTLKLVCTWMAKLMDVVHLGDEIEITASKECTF